MIVIDSSAMVDALVDEPANPELLALIADNELPPALIDYEVASALRAHALGGKLGEAQLEDAAADLNALVIQRYPRCRQCCTTCSTEGQLTVYDAAYVVLAQALETSLVTPDARMTEARKGRCRRPCHSTAPASCSTFVGTSGASGDSSQLAVVV